MVFLDETLSFPHVSQASAEGILAIGGDLSPERLVLAYKSGIFPWFDSDEPILWWSPNPRFVLFPEQLKVSKSMKQVLRNANFELSVNHDFEQVIDTCSKMKRAGQPGTWITNTMKAAYLKLHELGYAKSVEVWQNGELVGGLYGVDVGNGLFCGESMFAKVSNASKVGFISFIQNSEYKLIDCQVYTNHLASLGAKDIPRAAFLKYLE
ncbi:leucyl/phenylalanyl-tRNA--protein transferase [Subsaximicrobium wynnwilliamsii]|jgi:leucyl/phenylalanyl-tRNA--protein transferase|uniref:Leucyl/phenylalanyl-tRNA--protein transferase n=1 Tax=Subsaximicrobium wynnwilliamsii TaxID=291179 RepID=A0A5C6ZE16_9FLAO|nr:leucyl/phenylalanyl-tRNA--protein transferase [Subsaximicrobium wynnwilliamsii]TXD82533.1 leucyl/phenylalanyl-tRNA--protein transferase [Subsaximicrobium wynnwilliamsii]TXD88176.1 leucyl/phenylalanyl-tRNA--protein transferase [Subsaximicrobium wynnwilliamsii]TXE02191.1 leucyl/phenylalanyl-tRNA--protein transferase [Subsaximicrobium wynnwilliamsii]